MGPVIRWYVRLLSAALLLQGLAGGLLKWYEGRQDDLVHNLLHLLSGLWGLAAAGRSGSAEGARRFAWGFGLFYIALAVIGWLSPAPLSLLPLGPADHLFHLIVGGVTLVTSVYAGRVVASR
ncbi:MAG: DUF4383 domain-containing protein [Bacillota bacterium]